MNPALAFKAEIVLAFQLILRHRAPRLAVMLAALLLIVLLSGGNPEAGLAVRQRTVVLIGGALVAVASSRLLASGGPLDSVRRTASPWLLVPAGRLAGSVLFTLVVVLVAATVAIGGTWGPLPAIESVVKIALYAAATGAMVMVLTPLIGASAAASLGLVAAFFGSIPPSEVDAALRLWPLARGAAVLTWNTFPLGWRAMRWVSSGGVADALFLFGWMLLGVTGAGVVADAHGLAAGSGGR